MAKKKKSGGAVTPAPAPPPPEFDPNIPFFTWPPFPPIPAGVTLIPFFEYKAIGIQIMIEEDDDTVEYDGAGIRTVMLKTVHDPDKYTRKRKKKKKYLGGENGEGIRLPWWEDWEEAEELRTVSAIDPRENFTERFDQAGANFQAGRRWNPALQSLWDHYRLYTGLLANPPQPNQKKRQVSDDEVSDDELDGPEDTLKDTAAPASEEQSRFVEVGSPEDEIKMEKMMTYLSDPEKGTRIFLSSFFRDKGLFWSEPKLRDGPKLVAFFLNFLLRNRVLPEYDSELRRALKCAEQAKVELPRTKKIAMVSPDGWGKVCYGVWGTQLESAYAGMDDIVFDDKEDLDMFKEGVKTESAAVETATVSVPTDQLDAPADVDVDDGKRWEDHLREENIEKVSAEDLPGMEPMSVDVNGTEWTPPVRLGSGPERSGGIGWGVPIDVEADPSIIPAAESGKTTGDVVDGWENAGLSDEPNPWTTNTASAYDWVDDTPLPTIFTYLGPTNLPLTHAPIRVEESTRSIVSYSPPNPSSPSVLRRKLGILLLRPCRNPSPSGHERHAVQFPVLKSPRNGVPLERTVLGGRVGEEHDPAKDDIELLVDPVNEAIFLSGILVGGSWVQVARLVDDNDNGNGKEKGVDDEWWYMEKATQVLPAFWTEWEE